MYRYYCDFYLIFKRQIEFPSENQVARYFVFFLTRPRLSRWRLKEDRENNPFSVWSLKKEEEEEEEEKTLFQVKED